MILEQAMDEQPPAAPEAWSLPVPAPPKQEPRRSLIGLSALVVLLGAYSIWGVQSARSSLSAQRTAIDDLSGRLEALASENATLKRQVADARSQLEAARKGLAAADEAASHAGALALRYRSEALGSAQQLESAIDEQETQVGTLSGSVDGVKNGVSANRQDLDRAFGNLNQQNDLIARNREELDALKRSGSRDYVEFDLRESKAFTRVGPLSLHLNKTDDRHQRYTVTVVVNDRLVEKKDNALLEPVQFYMPGSRSVTELVAQEVQHGSIKGYVSCPKDTTAPVAMNARDSG
jgi:outer membrane murein-binding lipoprotein Lpp